MLGPPTAGPVQSRIPEVEIPTNKRSILTGYDVSSAMRVRNELLLMIFAQRHGKTTVW